MQTKPPKIFHTLKLFYQNHPAWCCFIIFFLMGLWQFQEGLFDSQNNVYIGGEANDNIVSINHIETLKDKVSSQGILSLFASSTPMEEGLSNLGEEKKDNGLIILDILLYILSLFFNSNLAYNLTSFISFLSIACAGYLLSREIGVGPFFSMIVALFLTHLETFEYKFNMHVDLASYQYPILLIWASLRIGRNPTLTNLSILALLFPIFSSLGLYYGYFGIFFCTTLILGYWFLYKKYKELLKLKFLFHVLLSFFILLIAFYIFHPVIRDILNQVLFEHAHFNLHEQTPVKRDFYEYNFWSLNNIFSIFQTGIMSLRSFFPFTAMTEEGKGTETVYRIGFGIPLLFIFLQYYFYKVKTKNKTNKNKNNINQNENIQFQIFHSREVYIWLLAMFVILGFSVNESYFFSLVRFSYNIVPSFRVGIRALIYFNIALIVIVLYYMENFYKLQKIKYKHIKYKEIFMGVVLIFLYLDVMAPGDPLYPKIYEAKLRVEQKAYLALRERPQGFLLELPLSSERVMPTWENEYLYYHFQATHRKKLVNSLHDASYRPGENWLRESLLMIWNQMTEADLENLRQAKIRYIAIHPTRNIGIPMNFDIFNSTKKLRLLSRDSYTSIFEFIDPMNPPSFTNQKDAFLSFMKDKYQL